MWYNALIKSIILSYMLNTLLLHSLSSLYGYSVSALLQSFHYIRLQIQWFLENTKFRHKFIYVEGRIICVFFHILIDLFRFDLFQFEYSNAYWNIMPVDLTSKWNKCYKIVFDSFPANILEFRTRSKKQKKKRRSEITRMSVFFFSSLEMNSRNSYCWFWFFLLSYF